MKMVRMLQSMAAERWTLMPGCEHPVRDDIALAWEAAGIAIVLGDPVPGALPLTREFGEEPEGSGDEDSPVPAGEADPDANTAPCGDIDDNKGKAGETDDPEGGDPAVGRTGKPRGRKAASSGGRK